MNIFNPFKCKHKRTYEVTTKMNDGSLVVNTYCRKCEATVRVDIEPLIASAPPHVCKDNKEHVQSIQCMNTDYVHKYYRCTICGLNWLIKKYDNGDERTPELEKLRHQGNLLEKVPEKYITVEIDKKYLTEIGDYL